MKIHVYRRSIQASVTALIIALSGCSTDGKDVAQRISAVEQNLRCPMYIEGRDTSGMNIFERMEYYNVPGMSVAVINNGQIEWARGYGVKEVGTADSVTTKTLFQAASISKPVSALGVMRLADTGRISFDTAVNTYLTSWNVPENTFTKQQPVTMRHLLTHSAGMNVHGFPGYATSDDFPSVVQVLNGEKPANTDPVRVVCTPGSTWRYSGGGYTAAQLLVQDVSETPFADYMKTNVLVPAGMASSTFEQPLPADKAQSAASAHTADGRALQGKWHIYPELAAAGLWTTPSDLCRFAMELQKASAGRSSAVIAQGAAEEMLEQGIGGWGLGVQILESDNNKAFLHGGSNRGFQCKLFAYVHKGRGAAVMTNSDNGEKIVNEVLRSIAYVYGWPNYKSKPVKVLKTGPADPERFAGDFRMKGQSGIPFVISVRSGQLVLSSPVTGEAELYPVSNTDFVYPEGGFYIRFVADSHGQYTQMKAGNDSSALPMVFAKKPD